MTVPTLNSERDGWTDSLVQRLTADKDREEFAELLHWFRSMPPGDEFAKITKLLGFLTLIGNKLPEALADEARALRLLSERIDKANAAMDERIGRLPNEIAAGVDPIVIAKAMSESFRQQLSATALHDTASLMKAAVITLKGLNAEVAGNLKPLTVELSEKTATLLSTLKQLNEVEHAAVVGGKCKCGIVLQVALALVVFVAGGIAGYLVHR